MLWAGGAPSPEPPSDGPLMMAPDVSSGVITFGFDSCASRASSRLIVEVDIGELLAALVAHNKASRLFLDRPWRREAAGGPSAFFYAVRKCSQ